MARRTLGLAALLGVLVVTASPSLSPYSPVRTPAVKLTQPPSPEQLPDSQSPEFTLRDPSGHEHSLAQLADRKAVVVVFLGSACPLARAYAPRLAELWREFEPRGVA